MYFVESWFCALSLGRHLNSQVFMLMCLANVWIVRGTSASPILPGTLFKCRLWKLSRSLKFCISLKLPGDRQLGVYLE